MTAGRPGRVDGVPVAWTYVAHRENELAVECLNCRTSFECYASAPFGPEGLAHELAPGTMYAAFCPECGHGHYVRGLQEPI